MILLAPQLHTLFLCQLFQSYSTNIQIGCVPPGLIAGVLTCQSEFLMSEFKPFNSAFALSSEMLRGSSNFVIFPFDAYAGNMDRESHREIGESGPLVLP